MTTGISAIGSYDGLSSLYGSYGSYYDPTMMAMMGGYGSYGMSNPMLMGGLGMMGMYNPTFMAQQTEMMKQMYSAQNEIQKMQLQNTTDLHAAKEQAQVYNTQIHDRAFFETVAVNGDVQNGIREIYDAIRRGDMDNVAQKYFELKQVILNKYSDHYRNSLGGVNDKENINHLISTLYSEIAGGYDPSNPVKPDLREDILRYGENAFQHGMNTTFLGNSGHNRLNAEECLNQIYGTNINDAGSKEKVEKIGRGVGRAKEFGIATAAGATAGATLLGLGKILPFGMSSPFRSGGRLAGVGKWAWVGAIAAGIGDALWQMGVIGNRA